ncbi:MAG: cobalamin biosynthesis protein [Acidilobaceae archaeon]
MVVSNIGLDLILKALYPGFELLILALLLSLILDLVYPEHRGVMLRIHPVHTSYTFALLLGKPYSSRLRGVIVWFIVMSTHLTIALILLILSYYAHPLLWVLVASLILKFSFSLKLLLDICYNAYVNLLECRLDNGRRYVQLIVRRNVYRLDKPHVVSACIESLAESLVDGFTSPLTYYAILGPLGALAQRIANTLDGALGYKTVEYARVGWFSAKMDTLLNYVPARLTALLIITFSFTVKNSLVEAFKVWRRWCRETESINAGHPMSAMAGALGVRLEKPGYYTLNSSSRLPEPIDIGRGLKIAIATSISYILLTIAIITILNIAGEYLSYYH